MTENFPALVAAVQVGTRKAVPARATDFPIDGVERSVLLELGALGLMRRAGARGVVAEPLSPAPPETLKVALGAADPLEEALDGSLFAALEWAREATRKGFVAPPAVVSKLVPLATRNPEFRPVLGERGRWLAGAMKVEVVPPTPPQAEWESLDPKGRVRLVEEVPDDLELFTKALSDRRKEVREAAVVRLVRMPISPAAQELRRRALEAVVFRKGLFRRELHIELPEPDDLPAWLPRANPYHGMGPKAMALFDLVSHVPPSAWNDAPERLLDLAKGTEHNEVLGLAWQAGAARFDDQAWLDAYFARMKTDRMPARSAVFERASEGVVDEYMRRWIAEGKRSLAGLVHVLALRDRPIPPALSRAVVEAVGRADATPDLVYRCTDLGRLLDLSAIPLVERGTGEPFDRWRVILDLRRRLLESLR